MSFHGGPTDGSGPASGVSRGFLRGANSSKADISTFQSDFAQLSRQVRESREYKFIVCPACGWEQEQDLRQEWQKCKRCYQINRTQAKSIKFVLKRLGDGGALELASEKVDLDGGPVGGSRAASKKSNGSGSQEVDAGVQTLPLHDYAKDLPPGGPDDPVSTDASLARKFLAYGGSDAAPAPPKPAPFFEQYPGCFDKGRLPPRPPYTRPGPTKNPVDVEKRGFKA